MSRDAYNRKSVEILSMAGAEVTWRDRRAKMSIVVGSILLRFVRWFFKGEIVPAGIFEM